MFRIGLIVLIVLLLKITTFACTWPAVQQNLLNQFQSSTNLSCNYDANSQYAINCSNKQNYSVSISNNSIYMILSTTVKHHILTQCWFDGLINTNCTVQLSEKKCQTWDLKIDP